MKIVYSYLILLFFFITTNSVISQTLTDSNLPIVIITTDNGEEIPDEPKIGANLKIIYRGLGERNYMTDVSNNAFLNYNGRVGIEKRGSSSLTFPQNSFAFETRLDDNISNNNVSLLDLPSENDWILLGTYADKSLMRDYLAHFMSRQIGEYSPRAKYVEVIKNEVYQGVYLLIEKIKIDKNRIDIISMAPQDIALPNVSGGYLLQENYDGTITLPHNGQEGTSIIIEDPEPFTMEQSTYLQSFFDALDASTQLDTPENMIEGFPTYIDNYSFYNYILINELHNNVDAYSKSTFYRKDRNGKLVFGPVWDFNFASGNSSFPNSGIEGDTGYTVDHWEINDNGWQGPKYLQRLFFNNSFRCHLIKRWQELRQLNNPFDLNKINTTIDSLTIVLDEAQQRHFQKWPLLGSCSVLSAPPGCDLRLTYQDEVNYFKQFLTDKALWIDNNIAVGFSNCTYPILPQLVINEIMYDPSITSTTNSTKISKKAAITATTEDFEFIEIKNIEATAVDLSGVYFRGGGIVYQFPANSSLGAGAIIVIASNATEFENRYGFAPFGQFTRDLSNSGENIILADGMGNIIDQVNYSAQAPWPNAYGKSLELKTPILDNSLAENWFQQNVVDGSPGEENVFVAPDPCLALPNIVINEINYNSISSSNSGDWIEIYNAQSSEVDISGWFLKDGAATMVVPANTLLGPFSYLVFCQNLTSFLAVYPTTSNYSNSVTGFGLSSSGENISLSDANDCLIDQLTYDEASPWPTSPNGQGFTLSLKQPFLNNELAENWAASTLQLGTPGEENFPNNPLPITLIDFEVKENLNGNQLNWQVSYEKNIEKYVVEYSKDAKSFEKVGEILANNSENYSFLHPTEFENIAYYRLKIIEMGGKIDYSKMIVIRPTIKKGLSVFPNPSSEKINITIPSKYLGKLITLKILDSYGKIMITSQVKPSDTIQTIHLNGLATGKYFVQINSELGLNYLPFIIQK
ncbi:MAG: CotH kinase family protein [Bacteroidota bacterium]